MDFVARVRRDWFLLLVTIVAPIYALLVLELPFLVAAINREPNFWDTASALRLFGTYGLGFVVAAPVSISLFVWWARRRRATFGCVARDGVVTIGVIAEATVWLARSQSSHTVLEIAALCSPMNLRPVRAFWTQGLSRTPGFHRRSQASPTAS